MAVAAVALASVRDGDVATTASLTLCTLLSAACEYSVEPPTNPTTATTADASDDGSMMEPTTGSGDNQYNYLQSLRQRRMVVRRTDL